MVPEGQLPWWSGVPLYLPPRPGQVWLPAAGIFPLFSQACQKNTLKSCRTDKSSQRAARVCVRVSSTPSSSDNCDFTDAYGHVGAVSKMGNWHLFSSQTWEKSEICFTESHSGYPLKMKLLSLLLFVCTMATHRGLYRGSFFSVFLSNEGKKSPLTDCFHSSTDNLSRDLKYLEADGLLFKHLFGIPFRRNSE